jgi:pseudouridylate synthase
MRGGQALRYGVAVARALAARAPVVALESTIVAHGLPRPDNLQVALEVERTVLATGAVPATIGMVDGELIVGLDEAQLTRLATADDVVKVSVRDLAVAAAAKADGATTVAATSAIAVRAGIHVFATGGLGGVHRGAAETFDESADLAALAQTPIAVVCAGVKSILDVSATLERLESLGVPVVGYRSRRFPGFYLSDGGFDLDWTVDSPEQIAQILRARAAHGVSRAGLVVANPLPPEEQLDPALHERALSGALAGLERAGITGKAVTPYLLAHFHATTGGRSLAVTIRIIQRNAELAARVAVALAVG